MNCNMDTIKRRNIGVDKPRFQNSKTCEKKVGNMEYESQKVLQMRQE